MVSVPKNIQAAALCTVAVSCGWKLNGEIYNFPGTNQGFVQEGTGIAIDPQHILTAGHIFDFPQQLGPPANGLTYKYLFLSPNMLNACSIHIRHEREARVNRLEMSYLPEEGKDIECHIVAWVDGLSPDVIRFTNDQMPIQTDLVLLRSATKLPMVNFPSPRAFHNNPNDKAETTVSEALQSLQYNGLPGPHEDSDMYPNTSHKDIISAYYNLYPNSLSWSTGPSVPGRHHPDIVFYRISNFCGASGGGVFDKDGKLVGSCLF